MTPNAQTLTQRLAAGRMPMNDALRCALQIVDALRQAHEEVCCHGSLTPDAVILNGTGVELVPAQPGAVEALTPYTAPERLKGEAPDARTDIFSLGALLYEMFTGRRAFAGESAGELAAAIESSRPVPIGDTALDRVVLNCLVKDPSGRWQRVQQVHMEFRILAFSTKRAQAAAVPRQPDPVLHAELRQVESRLASRLEQQYGEAAAGLRHLSAQLPLLESNLFSHLEQQNGETSAALQHIAAELPRMESQLAACLERGLAGSAADLQHVAAELPLVASRLEQHEGLLAGLHEAATQLPQLESHLTSRLEQHEGLLAGLHEAAAQLPELESRLTSRLEQHEGLLAGLHEAATQLPQLESRLNSRLEQHEGLLAGLHEAAAQLPQLESRLTSRLEQQEGLLAGLHDAAAQLPQLESRLTSRLEQHEGLLTGLQQAAAELPQLESRLTSRLEQHESSLASLRQQLPQLDSRLEQNNVALENLRHVSAEQKSGLEIASQTLTTVQERMVSLESQLGDARERAERAAEGAREEAKRQAATLQVSLSGEIHALELTVKSNAAAIDSIRAAMARADDFMERVVEALESLQTMVLDQARDRAMA